MSSSAMAAHEPVSLTGADCGAPQTHLPSVSRALTRLRAGVLMVALLAIAALIVQIGVWGLATFTSIRWADQSPSPAITQGEPRIVVQDRAQEGQRPSPFEAHGIDTIAAGQSPVDVNRVPGAGDGVLRMAASGALGIGSMAIVALVPLIALGALLAINSSTEGVEQAVSAFMWVIVVCLLTTPVSQALGLPWDIASLWRYERLTGDLADRPDPALVDWAGTCCFRWPRSSGWRS